MENNMKTNEGHSSTLQIIGKYEPKKSKVYLNRKLGINVKFIQA
jgi:hypothetical protein